LREERLKSAIDSLQQQLKNDPAANADGVV
jgi:hypothetical protein